MDMLPFLFLNCFLKWLVITVGGFFFCFFFTFTVYLRPARYVERKERDLAFNRDYNIELHFYERIAQLEGLVENTKKFRADQLDVKNNILTKLLDENIFREFSKTPSQNDVIDGLNKTTVQQFRKFTWKFTSTMSRFQYSNAQQECFCK